jgi:hypothetical protein
MLIAAGFAVALLSWPVALVLAAGLCGDLRPGDRLGGALSARHLSRLRRLLPPVPRLIPRLTPAKRPSGTLKGPGYR